ncbi:uncharacterized protein LOC128756133 isoform X1 [Synchiropus splendidus]|uniref:uncharacterized protein LOC128756133 isoform X1 n=1 Tax=Synchiropus splendidus TaxID=270530 RepID=UPI00237D7CAD|nr:uncharacterized protein LOC128756133 isoform X1 [Synchiropus splendidus]
MNLNGMHKLVTTLCFILLSTPVAETMTTVMPITAMETEANTQTGGVETTVITEETTGSATETTIITQLPGNTATPPRTIVRTTAIIPNYDVAPLTGSFSSADCGSTKLCAAEPTQCDPSTAADCFFFAATQTSGRNFECQFSGPSAGYIAVTLSTDPTLGGNDTTYVCANDRGNVRFIGAFLDNQVLSQTSTLNANEVKGRVDNGNEILCTFKATVPASASRTTGFTIGLSKGSYNSTTGALGNTDTVFKSPTLDLANSSANVTNVLANTTSSTTTATPTTRTATVVSTTSQATVPQQSLTQGKNASERPVGQKSIFHAEVPSLFLCSSPHHCGRVEPAHAMRTLTDMNVA